MGFGPHLGMAIGMTSWKVKIIAKTFFFLELFCSKKLLNSKTSLPFVLEINNH
jgi:hypothetical protein